MLILFLFNLVVMLSHGTQIRICQRFVLHACMCMCVQLHVSCVYLNVEAKGQPLVSSSILLSTLLEKGFTGLSSPSRLNWLASEPQGSTCLHFPSTGNYKHAPPFLVFLCGFWAFELRFSWLAQQALYWLIQFPCSICVFYLVFSVFILTTQPKSYFS